MAKNRTSVNEVKNLYGGRTSPSRKAWLGDCAAEDLQKPQDPINQHGPGYSNNTPRSWLHGNGDATTRPGFDHSPKRGSERR
jgi:hypothetical protein